jgi:hypothetical protein
MRIKAIISFLFIFFYFFSGFTSELLASEHVEEDLPAVSVINEIRGTQLGLKDSNLLESLRGQWNVTKEAGIEATWLWQYSPLEEDDLVDFAKKEMKGQEFGIFLEIDQNFADKSVVRYRGKGPWYFSDGLFLVSYDQDERHKLIDTVFEKFKEDFGYYPKTVGAWWVGAESIKYMRDKYGINAVLQCADQFNTDKYSIWGTPWSIPYLPSNRNAAIPANNYSDRIPNVVVLQWATRDPVSGYGSSVTESTYSIQDYGMKYYKAEEYLPYLRNIYLNKPLDHMVVGLEGGFGPGTYDTTYKNNILEFKKWENEGFVKIQTAAEYSSEFLESRRILPPSSYFLTKAFETNDQSFWYNSPNYRLLIQKHGNDIYLADFRDYLNTPQEEFYELSNTQPLLRINAKSIVDSVRFPKQKIKLLSSKEPLEIAESEDGKFLKTGGETIGIFTDNVVSIPAINKYWDFKRSFNSNIGPNYDVIAVSMVLVYVIFLYVNERKKVLKGASFFGLVFGLIILFPFYSSGFFFNESLKFTPISLSIFDFMNLGIIDPGLKVFLYFQFIPLVALILMHYFLIIKPKNNDLTLLIFVALLVLVFLNLDDFFTRALVYFAQGKKAMLISVLSLAGFLGFVFVLIYLHRKNRSSLMGKLLFLVSLFFIWFNQDEVFARKNYIITNFEWEMLNKVYSLRENVFYPKPEFKTENFYNTFPLLITDKFYAEKLTSVEWRTVHYGEEPIRYAGREKIVIVSRYTGVELEENSSLNKIMDNSQIAIYQKK